MSSGRATTSWGRVPTAWPYEDHENLRVARGPYFWQVGSTMVTPCGPRGTVQVCSGHWTMGHIQWINNDGDPFGQYHMRSFSSLGSYNPVISAVPSALKIPLDQHPSWNNQ